MGWVDPYHCFGRTKTGRKRVSALFYGHDDYKKVLSRLGENAVIPCFC